MGFLAIITSVQVISSPCLLTQQIMMGKSKHVDSVSKQLQFWSSIDQLFGYKKC